MIKRILLLILSFALVFSFASCNEEKPDQNQGQVNNPPGGDNGANEDSYDLSALDFTIIYPELERKHKNIAESFKEEFKTLTGKDLPIQNNKFTKSEYEIQFGKLTDRDESKSVLNKLKTMVISETSAYSICVKDKAVVVTATSNDSLKLAAEELLSYVKDGKLILKKDFEKTYVIYENGNETIKFDETSFASDTTIISISINSKKLKDFRPDVEKYSLVFPSVENYPKVSYEALNPLTEVNVVQAKDNNGTAEIRLKSQDGTKVLVYTFDFTYAETAKGVSEIVNKNAADGVVTFVFDDGYKRTADVITSNLLDKYDSVVLSYAIVTNNLADILGEGKSGKYNIKPNDYTEYNQLQNSKFDSVYQYEYEFWLDALAAREGIELISHSHTHDGPSIVADPLLELKASQQILRDLCLQNALTYVNPGVGDYGKDPTYVDLRVNSGIYIGARGSGEKATTAPWLRESYMNRYSTYALAVNQYGTKLDSNGNPTTNASSSRDDCLAAGISRWTDHIENAMNSDGWACFCIHNVIPAGETSTSKWHIYEEQLDALFAYSQGKSEEGKLWIANYTEAQMYYNQWASAEIETVVESDESVAVTLTIPQDEPNRELYTAEMTVKVSVPINWTGAKYGSLICDVNENKDGTKFIYANITPGETIIITSN